MKQSEKIILILEKLKNSKNYDIKTYNNHNNDIEFNYIDIIKLENREKLHLEIISPYLDIHYGVLKFRNDKINYGIAITKESYQEILIKYNELHQIISSTKLDNILNNILETI